MPTATSQRRAQQESRGKDLGITTSEAPAHLRLVLGETLNATGKLRLAYRHLVLSFRVRGATDRFDVPVKCL
jgi:hypothetical protein